MTQESWEEMEARHAKERTDKVMELSRMAYRRGLDNSPMREHGRPTIRLISEVVASKIGLEARDLRSKKRTRQFAHGRFMVFSEAEKAGHSLSAIGRHFGLDHTSVLHGIRRHREMTAEGRAAQEVAG